jgi:23S rRNA (uridine2552-2'-O)-methyltransferase
LRGLWSERGRTWGFLGCEVCFFQADLLQTNIPEFLESKKLPQQADLVISDMAPKTTGIRSVDQARSSELCEMALMVAGQVLKKEGHFICKFFQGQDFNAFRDKVRSQFNKVEIIKPDSTRSHSFEIFIIGLKKKF